MKIYGKLMNATRQSCEQHLPQTTGRVPFWDVLKFFAILLVVYGHVSGALGCKVLEPWASNFRIGMNMPLFFIISGYFAAKTIEKGDWRRLGRHLVGYFWPLAAVSVVFAILSVVFRVEGSECGLVGYVGRRFLFAGWYLWVLAICFVIVFLCRRIASGWKFYFTLGVGYCICLIDIPCWYLSYTRAMLPFFIAGLLLSQGKEVWKDWRIGLSCFAVYLIVCVVQGNISKNGLSFYNSPISWMAIVKNPKVIGLAAARLANGMIGSIGICWVVHYLLIKCKTLECLAPLGTTTLGVYVLHQWILARIPYSGGCWALLMTAMLFVFCHLIVVYTRRNPLVRRFFWGEFK